MRKYPSPILISSIAALGLSLFSLSAHAAMTGQLSGKPSGTSGSNLVKVQSYTYESAPHGYRHGTRSHYRPYHHTVPRVVPAPTHGHTFTYELKVRPIQRPDPVYAVPPTYAAPQPVAPVYSAPVYAAPQAVQPGYSMPPSHVNWCATRYRTYTAYDNTYQPSRGVRSQCISPFWR